MSNNGYLHHEHHLYLDNFYSRPGLFEALKELGTGACGTVRLSRRGLPEEIKTARLQLKKDDDPVYYRKSDVLVCSWHDTTRVNFFSTTDNNDYTQKQIRSKQSETGFRDVKKPKCGLQLQGGVNLFDQKCTSYLY
ncbi:uncharacterized protein LOC106473469 [Limulus polyphemus]|uniref:Uncharacterized protein LOC106473469 n=1 Tax=Limulus polyphemus TaxID=6850 RepID=A0ABM1BVQ6_LIMPO|nr:uncharacterized protein LOC106473469 [Limulus polyphemus]